MRLLELNSELNVFSFTECFGSGIPPYAILSHTWGADADEVTFNDVVEGNGRSKAGYRKLQFCGEQAKKDNLQYFWVDTCCIDKSNFTELSEAINSMFRWYQNASRCYVFLSDFSIQGKSKGEKDAEFRKSRWFTRGWTLQELIAPRSVEFFSQEGEKFGDKRSLEQELHQITRIAIPALRGSSLSQFSVSERMSWAAERTTKREEDKAYSLLGIFDCHIPLIYGEGERRAFRRLREDIRQSANHQFDEPLNDQPAFLSSPKRSETQHDNVPWIVPFERNPHFTGRDSELANLEKSLFTEGYTTKVAISGLGGVGKTQLALELVYRTKEKHKDCSIIWIPATNMESLYQAYLDVARQLGLSGWEEQEADVNKLVQEYLSEDNAGQWLLVFDNADDIDMWIAKAGSEYGTGSLIDYLPKSRQGSIVFTTRDRKAAVKLAQQNIVEISEMNEEVATRLLQKCLVRPDLVNNDCSKDKTELLAELTYLPLAITQAAAYINENGITLGDYLSLLIDQEERVIELLSEEFEDERRYRNIKNPVATTWLISFEQIRRREPLAANYLSLMSCLDPKDIPQSFLPPGPSRKKETEAIGALNAYSFIIKRPADKALDLHRLVHLAMRGWLQKEGLLAQFSEDVIKRLEEVFPSDDHKNRSIWRLYLPHALFALESHLVDANGKSRINLMWRCGKCLYHDGRWKEAEILFGKVMEARKRLLGPEHLETLSSMAKLASTYLNQGRLAQSEELLLKVMEISKRVLGPEDPNTLTAMTAIAEMYREQGRWSKAAELGKQVIETSKEVLGIDHPITLRTMKTVAGSYMDQWELKRAEELAFKTVERSKRVFGVEHPDTLTIMNILALSIGRQGRWIFAEGLFKQIKQTAQKALGDKHPFTLTVTNNVASAYRNQGRLEEAEKLQLQVLEIRKGLFGEKHPKTLISMNYLVVTYRKQRRLTDAEKMGLQVVETRKEVLGRQHPETLRSMYHLALVLKELNRDQEALKLMEECVQLQTRILGFDHRYTVSSFEELTRWQLEKVDI
jgi:tetratricopeptide (TPR) repeat protein